MTFRKASDKTVLQILSGPQYGDRCSSSRRSLCTFQHNHHAHSNTEVPAALKYVKVITTTTAGGIDENEVVENEDGSFELPTTITVLVSVEQAKILANYEKSATMHVALVYRGDEASAAKFLKAQDEYLKKLNTSEGKQNG